MLIDQKCVFITGTDTGVGKSIFTAFLAMHYLNQGKKIAISKPIQTGIPKDTDFLAELTGNKIPIFNTYSFSLAASPTIAAKEENKNIDINKIILDIKNLEKEFDHVIVEGVGGIAVPVTEVSRSQSERASPTKWAGGQRSEVRKEQIPLSQVSGLRSQVYLVANLIKDLNYPVIIVSRPTLGTINHTILTIEFAKQKGLNILGFVISGYDEKTNDLVIKTAPDLISEITSVQCITKIPFFEVVDYNSLNSFVVKYDNLKGSIYESIYCKIYSS